MTTRASHDGSLTDTIESVSAEQQAQLIRQFDHESNFRRLVGPVGMLVTTVAVILSAFHIYTAGFGLLVEIKHRAFHLALVLGLIFLVFPRPRPAISVPGIAKEWGWALAFGAFYLYLAWDLTDRLVATGELRYAWPFLALVGFIIAISLPLRFYGGYDDKPAWIDWPLALLAAGVSLYQIVFFDAIFIERVGSPIAQDYMMGVLAIIMVMEASRRTMGPLLPLIGMTCLLYALLGRYMPGVLAHRGYTVVRVVNHIYVGTEGIYGIAVGVVATYVFHFVLFGVLAQMTGLGRLFMDLATIAAGRFSGGPAKVCVVSSGLFGMISGSPVANAVTTGSLTIPLMKKYGFTPRFAAGVEASASCGGQVTPPVMGASAFVMAELLGVPYKELVLIAIVPALFHYFACLMMVHFEARRLRLLGVEAELIPRIGPVIGASWHLVLPLIVLVTMLLLDYTPFLAAFWGIVLCFVCSYIPLIARRFGNNRLQGQTLTLKPLIAGLEEGAKYALAIGAACACVGLILGTLTLSGLGFKFSGAVIDLAGSVAKLAVRHRSLQSVHREPREGVLRPAVRRDRLHHDGHRRAHHADLHHPGVDRRARARHAGRAADRDAFLRLLLRRARRRDTACRAGRLRCRRHCRIGAHAHRHDGVPAVDGQGAGAVHVRLHAGTAVHRLHLDGLPLRRILRRMAHHRHCRPRTSATSARPSGAQASSRSRSPASSLVFNQFWPNIAGLAVVLARARLERPRGARRAHRERDGPARRHPHARVRGHRPGTVLRHAARGHGRRRAPVDRTEDAGLGVARDAPARHDEARPPLGDARPQDPPSASRRRCASPSMRTR